MGRATAFRLCPGPVGDHLAGVALDETETGDLADLDRVEVLRGPQGTLYGRNATGGAIKIVTRKPSFDTSGSVSADFGFHYKELKATGFVTGKIAEHLAGLLSASYRTGDGFIVVEASNLPGSSALRRVFDASPRAAAIGSGSEALTGVAFDVVELVDEQRFAQIVSPLGDLPVNLPIALYPGMKIGQISFLRMTTAAEHPYGSDATDRKSVV
mgnify:CR=1 FL=1